MPSKCPPSILNQPSALNPELSTLNLILDPQRQELSRTETLLLPSLSSRTLSPTLTNRFRQVNTPSLNKWPYAEYKKTKRSMGSRTQSLPSLEHTTSSN